MGNSVRILMFLFFIALLVAIISIFLGNSVIALFQPKGFIAHQESQIIIFTALIMLAIALPMLFILFWITYKFKENNSEKFDPENEGGFLGQFFLWIIPIFAIIILAPNAWRSTHLLDPYSLIASSKKTVTIEVVALRWKWLFIYPEEHIATINYIEFPSQTPVHFLLTAEGPMSSFWIPQLGSQIYAMATMKTQLSLIASTTGNFQGRDTEINGSGYAGMTFQARSVSEADFNKWINQIQNNPRQMDKDAYNLLANPSEYDQPEFYGWVEPKLFDWVLIKDMMPPTKSFMPPMQ